MIFVNILAPEPPLVAPQKFGLDSPALERFFVVGLKGQAEVMIEYGGLSEFLVSPYI